MTRPMFVTFPSGCDRLPKRFWWTRKSLCGFREILEREILLPKPGSNNREDSHFVKWVKASKCVPFESLLLMAQVCRSWHSEFQVRDCNPGFELLRQQWNLSSQRKWRNVPEEFEFKREESFVRVFHEIDVSFTRLSHMQRRQERGQPFY